MFESLAQFSNNAPMDTQMGDDPQSPRNDSGEKPSVANVSASSPKAPQVDANSEATGFWGIANEATKYTVFAVFILYVLGFLIWHSYLGKYGLSSISFLQTEYLSAAICFIIMFIFFGLPPALLYERWTRRTETRKPSAFDFTFFTLLIWSVICMLLQGFFFQAEGAYARSIRKIARGLMFAFIPLSLLWLLLRAKWMKGGKSKWLSVLDRLNPAVVAVFSIWVLCVANLYPAVNEAFLLATAFSVVGAMYAGKLIGQDWVAMRMMAKVLICITVCLGLIFNVLLFGDVQFGQIPRDVGGGRPEVAYVKFSEQSKDIARSLGLPAVTNIAPLNGFHGPISILLKSDKEIVFVNFAEAHLSNPVRLRAKQVRSEMIDVVVYAK